MEKLLSKVESSFSPSKEFRCHYFLMPPMVVEVDCFGSSYIHLRWSLVYSCVFTSIKMQAALYGKYK